MTDSSILVFAAFAAQTVGAAVIAILLFGFLRQYGRSYLAHLTASWAALGVYHLGEAAVVALGQWWKLPEPHPAREAAAVIAGVAGYLQIAWLLFGVYELPRRRPVRLRATGWVILVNALSYAAVIWQLRADGHRAAALRRNPSPGRRGCCWRGSATSAASPR